MAISLQTIKPIITKNINDTEHFISPTAIITEEKQAIEHIASYFSPSTPIGITPVTTNVTNKFIKPLLNFWA